MLGNLSLHAQRYAPFDPTNDQRTVQPVMIQREFLKRGAAILHDKAAVSFSLNGIFAPCIKLYESSRSEEVKFFFLLFFNCQWSLEKIQMSFTLLSTVAGEHDFFCVSLPVTL